MRLPSRENPSAHELQASEFVLGDSCRARWYAVYTRSRYEKKVVQQLVGKEVVSFLPVRRLPWKWRNRSAIIEFPLFSGYVFVNIRLSEQMKVLTTKGVVRMVGPRQGPEPIPDEQIENIIMFVEQNLACDPYPYLRAGQRVEVRRGPLAGVQGILARKKGKYKLVISVDILQKAVAVEIDTADVEPI